MYYVRYPLSFRQVEDILSERGIDICHETVRFWVNRFGAKFAKKIQKRRAGHHSNWQWHLDEVFVKTNGERFYLWRAVDQEVRFWNALLQNDVIKLQRRSSLLKQCVNTAHQRLSQRISYHPMAPLFVKLALWIDSFVEAGQIIGVKTHTYRFDGESEQCSYLNQ